MKKIFIVLILIVSLFSFNFNVYATDNGSLDNVETMEQMEENTNYKNFNDQDIVCNNDVHLSHSLLNISYYTILVFQIAAPIMIVIFGMFDLARGMMSQKDDEMKKGQATFIKRLVAGIMLFLVITIVKLILNLVAGEGIMECVNCFLNGAKSCR